jgi:O-antigen ligase
MLGTLRYSRGLLQLERFLLMAFLALLVCVPLPFGSDRIWASGLLSLGLSALLGASALLVVLRGQSIVRRCQTARWPLLALGLLAALLLAQIGAGVPDPDAAQAPLLFTADPYQTRYYLLCTLNYLFAFVLVLLLVTSERRGRVVVFTLVASALLQALLGIVLLSTKASYLAFFESMAHGAQTTGTFVHRNHLACYLYLGLSLGIGWMLGALQGSRKPLAAKQMLVGLLRFMLTPRMVLRLLLVVLVIALVLTRSRMGNAAFVAGLLALAALLWWRMPTLRKLVSVVVVSLLLVDVVIIGQWVGLEKVVQRMEATAVAEDDRRGEETLEARLQPTVLSLPLIAQQPWFGHGGGTFYTVFTPYKSNDMLLRQLYFDHAHNDYIEILVDTGVVGLGLMLLVAGLTARRAWLQATPEATASTRGIAYAGWMAMACVAVHSVVDFSMQIPANALTFTTILALVWASPWGSKRSPRAPFGKQRAAETD